MKRLLIPTTAAVALLGTTALADPFRDAVVAKYQDMGFEFIEVKTGPTQLKVEAFRGSSGIEVIYDRATGAILKQENERPDADEIGRTGVEFDTEDEDFLDDDDDDQDDDDEDDQDDDNDDEDEEDDDDDEEEDEDDEDNDDDEGDD